ncbi:MAG: YicC family protein [Bacteriovoracaceae bacterium]
MTIQSMTGFGKGEIQSDNYGVIVEIKSVNHRFRDIRFKMSSAFSSLEMEMKKYLNDHFHRGSFDISINYRRSEKNFKLDIVDENKVKTYVSSIKQMIGHEVQLSISPTEFLRSEFYKEVDLSQDTELTDNVWKAYKKALEELGKSRSDEGKKLLKVFNQHVSDYKEQFAIVERNADLFQKSVEERLRKRFQEMTSEIKIDEPRFLQEIVYYLEKMDIHEEINRIKGHLQKLDQLLSQTGEVGRQLEFLFQELGRETNTIGSKSTLNEISEAVVQMKVYLEKMREQGLNLE